MYDVYTAAWIKAIVLIVLVYMFWPKGWWPLDKD
jgi:hypothetical protein